MIELSDSDSIDSSDDEMKEIEKPAGELKIPERSKKLYEKQYKLFQKWRFDNKCNGADEELVLSYFKHLSETFAPTTLWATFTKLKTMLYVEENIDMSKYTSIILLLKKLNENHSPISSKVFSFEDVSRFLNEAPDDIYLLHKVILIMGIYGNIEKKALMSLRMSNITRQGKMFHIKVVGQNGLTKSFVTAEGVYPIIKKYIKLRPDDQAKFLLLYRHKKLVRQNVGKEKLGTVPKDIAKFLNLPNPELYTGRAYKNTAIQLRKDKSIDLLQLTYTAEKKEKKGKNKEKKYNEPLPDPLTDPLTDPLE